MKIEEVICDQCGARKGKTNHWFSLYRTEGSFHIYKHGNYENAKREQVEIKDICGLTCALKQLSYFIQPGSSSLGLSKDVNEIIETIEEGLPQ